MNFNKNKVFFLFSALMLFLATLSFNVFAEDNIFSEQTNYTLNNSNGDAEEYMSMPYYCDPFRYPPNITNNIKSCQPYINGTADPDDYPINQGFNYRHRRW